MKAGRVPKNLTHRIVHELGVAIVTGRYSAAKPFPVESELCKTFGASRSVLREAVKMLTAKGLLRAKKRQGTWVQSEDHWNLLDPDVLFWMLERKFSHRLLLEFTQMRLAVEPRAAALAAEFGSPQDKAAIVCALERMEAAGRGEDDPLESDIAFHAAILWATGNRFYAQLRELIETALRFSIRQTNSYKGVSQASVADHKRVSEAILAGHANAAAAAMSFLIEEALALITKAMAESGDTAPPAPAEAALSRALAAAGSYSRTV